MQFFQISTGLGAGNLGDEVMARAFWSSLPAGWRLQVELFPEHVRYRGGYPAEHRYCLVTEDGLGQAARGGTAGLLACGTPVNETEGLQYPMQFVAARLDEFHRAGTPVDAVGVGVDFLHTRRARALFAASYAPIRTWTVRTEDCREALLQMGVGHDQIAVGADWAWLYRPERNLAGWAADYWRTLGIDPEAPLAAVNLVNLVWQSKLGGKREIACALDRLQQRHGFQIAFFCNECRGGDMFDLAAAQAVRQHMKAPSVMVPNEYWSVDEALGLLGYADLAISQRYHFTIFAVMAGGIPINIVRGHKMRGLVKDLGIPASCSISDVSADRLEAEAMEAWAGRVKTRAALAAAGERLAMRAARNLDLVGAPA